MAAAVFKSSQPGTSKRLTPACSKSDKYAALGQQLLAATQGSAVEGEVERALAVLRLLMTLATGLLHTTSDAQDAPVCVLGQHYLTTRSLGHAVDGGQQLVRVQEICSFDTQEAPREQTWDAEGTQLARLQLRLTPTAKVKTKKLGREELIKVHLMGGGCSLWLRPSQLPTAASGAAADPAPAAAQPAQGETYDFTLPALVLRDPLSSSCRPSLKGDLTLTSSSGCVVCVTLSEDGSVAGQLEKRATRQEGGGRVAAGPPQYVRVGSFSGNWRSGVTVDCPGLGMAGTVLQVQAGGGPLGAPAPKLDLAALPPMLLPRLWSAVLDSIMFSDPRSASGKGALELCRNVARLLHGYPLGPAMPGAAAAPGGAAAAGATAGAAASRGRTAATTATSGAGDGSEDEELLLLRPAGGGAARKPRAGDTASEVPRNVPPSVMAQHAMGHHLTYQLQLQVVHVLSPLIATP